MQATSLVREDNFTEISIYFKLSSESSHQPETYPTTINHVLRISLSLKTDGNAGPKKLTHVKFETNDKNISRVQSFCLIREILSRAPIENMNVLIPLHQ